MLPTIGISPLPEVDLRHMLLLTDDTGILQHATTATPNLHHGYCTDDNARALIAGVMFCHLWPGRQTGDEGASRDSLLVAMQRYLAFLSYAFDPETRRFKNFMDYDRTWKENVGSEDSHARALWALGIATRRGHMKDIRGMAEELFRNALPQAAQFTHIRPWAYALLGIDQYRRSENGCPEAEQLQGELAERLYEAWKSEATEQWPWWEDSLTWGNAKPPHALLVSGHALGREDMVRDALSVLRWVCQVQTNDHGQLSIIGNRGWYVRGKERAQFDQQPIEAKALVQACLCAARLTAEEEWTRRAKMCFEWFRGENDVNTPLYNPDTGGCHDGLVAEGAAPNQGAESTLAYILSVLEIHSYARAQQASQDLET